MTPGNESNPVTPERLMGMAWGYAAPLVVEAALEFGVFDRLNAAPTALPELATATGASVRGLRALLDALVGLGLLARDAERYRLTAESAAYLVSGTPEFRGPFFRHHRDQLLPQWLQLKESVRTGRPVEATNRGGHGPGYFAAFVESLFPGGYGAARALGHHLGVAAAAGPVRVLDIGAGSGVWGIALAELSPLVRVRAVDWPDVLAVTRRVAARRGVGDRLETVPGDFLEADFGRDQHVATLGHVLHSEGADRIQRLLARVREALAPGGVIAIQEFVPHDDRTGPVLPLLFAVNMLVNTEAGGTYTLAELRGWLAAAGFRNVRTLDVPAVSPLVLADRP